MEPNTQPNTQPNTPVNNIPPVSNIPPMGNMQTSVSENKSSIGSIIGTIIVIAIIILGGLYFWGKRIDESKMKESLVSDTPVETPTAQPAQIENQEANAIKSVSSSDDLNSLEAELKATNLDNLGAELNATAELE